MRIGFDARMIDHPGIGRYISNLLSAMLKLNTEHQYVLFGSRQKLSAISYQLSAVAIIDYNAPIYSLKEQLLQPFDKYNLDVLHCPHFNIPYFYKGKLVVTIHDLIYMIFPESVPCGLARMYTNFMISNSITKAAKIIAVSENTKKDILRFFKKARPDNIEVIYEAADPCFRRVTNESKLRAIKEKYNLPDKFILFVGSLKKHKNIERLIDACIDLKSRGIQHKLAIIGRCRPREEQVLRKIKSADVLYLGEVSTEDLVAIYNLATLLVIPSLYEGFGLPALEAMACSLPVTASTAPSLPEIVGDAAVLFDPQNTSSISNKIHEVLNNENFRQNLIEKGLKRVTAFSWEKAARQTLELYKKV